MDPVESTQCINREMYMLVVLCDPLVLKGNEEQQKSDKDCWCKLRKVKEEKSSGWPTSSKGQTL